MKEFIDPLSSDYDIKMSLKEEKEENSGKMDAIKQEFFDLYCELGLPEMEELIEMGINVGEFKNPTVNTINKMKTIIRNQKNESRKIK